MPRIVISARVPHRYNWLSGDIGDITFGKIYRKLKEAFTERVNGFGLDEDSVITDFVAMKTTLDRANKLVGEDPLLCSRFFYKMNSDRRLYVENSAAIIQTFGNNSGYSDFLKWRARNAFGKIIDHAGHTDGFELEMRVYHCYNLKPVRPVSDSEVFYFTGSKKFEDSMTKQVKKKR